jgi:hypothetical protein
VLYPASVLFPHQIYLPLILKGGGGGVTSPLTNGSAVAASAITTFPVYTEWIALDNHFSASGWMGNLDSMDVYECERVDPHSGELAIRVTYEPTGTVGWAGVYWQEPPNNWGTFTESHDLSGATALTFWARGDQGGEIAEFHVGGIWGYHPDSLQPSLSTGPIVLSNDWQPYSIDLRGYDLSHTIGGFAFVVDDCSNPNGAVFFLDDIVYEFDPQPDPTPMPTSTPVTPYTFDVYTDGDALGNHYVPSGWMGDWQAIELTECWSEDVYSGSTAIQSDYHYAATGSGSHDWSGVFWLHPADNWADRPGGYDLSGAQALTFWARGQEGGERIKFQMGGVTSGDPLYNDSVSSPFPVENWISLSSDWQPYTITLPASLDLSRVVGGFVWATDWSHNCEAHPDGLTFYLDDISYWFNLSSPPTPMPSPAPISVTMPFTVYADEGVCGNHFIPSGWMGDLGDIHLQTDATQIVHSGSTAIRVTYDALGIGAWVCDYTQSSDWTRPCQWAGVYWQEPENNWATLPGGYDLSGATHLRFWVRGQNGGERVRFYVGGIGVCGDDYPDSLRPALNTEVLTLTSDWQQVEIDLRGHDLSSVIGGFGWAANQCSNPGGATFYLDDIVFESDPSAPPAVPVTPSGSSFAVYTDHDAPGNHYVPSGWMGATEDVSLLECATDEVYSGTTSIRVSYSPSPFGAGWAGVYWQDPANNWADRAGGHDLTGASRLSFWAKSTVAGKVVKFIVGGIGYNPGTCTPQWTVSCPEFLDSLCPTIEATFTLSDTWQRYEIPIPSYRNLNRVVGGFGWAASQAVTFYLDDIVWEFDD